MASIQIREIETPMEELSYDAAGNITGGLVEVDILVMLILDFAEGVIEDVIQLIRDILA